MESIELHELGNDIFDAFKELSGVQDIASHSVGKRLISEEQRFRLWAHSLGLHNQGHSSLDYRVRDAVAVKSRLADILVELKENLDNLVSLYRGERQPFEIAATAEADSDDAASDRDRDARSTVTTSTSPSHSSDEMSFNEVDFRMESVAETLDALYSLATKIKNPRNRPQRTIDELFEHVPAHKRKELIQEREMAAIAVVCHVQRQQLSEGLQHGELQSSGMSYDEILEQYASPSNWLVRRAGIANARRKQQFVYWKEHAERINRGPAGNDSSRHDERQHRDAPAADNKQSIQTQSEQGGHLPMQLDMEARMAGSLATSATRLDETFIKLDDQRSVVSHQSRVSTVMNLRGEKLEWPSPPDQTESSKVFTCPYCKIICPRKYLAKEAWCVHLIHDLQPYHCTFEHCHDPHRIYGTRQEWLEHESLHTRVWHCAVHNEEFETQPEYTAHLHEKHPEQKAEYFSPELIAAVVAPSLRLHRDCPFCPTAFSEATALQKHVTFHLERLALLSLPADNEDETDKSESALGSHEGQRRGRVGSIEVDFADEEQHNFTDIFESTTSDQPGPEIVMADIQETVDRFQEESSLPQWLAYPQGADVESFQPMESSPLKRSGRSNPLPGEERAKVSNMRKIKACMRCRIRKRECDDDVISCKHCSKAFPKHPEVCVREKLSDARFPENSQGIDIWTRESTPVSLLRQKWQLVGTPYQVIMKINQSNDSPGLAQMLQSYVVNARPFTLATDYYFPPANAGFSGAPMHTLSSWAETAETAETQLASNPVVGTCLAPGQENLPRDLLVWAEKQLLRDLYYKQTPDFESAILSFLLALRDSSLDLHGASSSSGKKKPPACVDPKNLVGKVCEMRCWYLIWQTSKLYMCTNGGVPYVNGYANSYSQLPPTVILELREKATEALIACEKEILLELDELSPDRARHIELPLWACIWQMILIYRQLVSGYSKLAHSQLASSMTGGSVGLTEVSVLSVVEHLYRLLVIKYSAYFGSASPVFPKKGQPPTAELLQGDGRLSREWDNVLLRRKEFYRTVSDVVATDVPLRTLIVDVENALEHRSRRRPK